MKSLVSLLCCFILALPVFGQVSTSKATVSELQVTESQPVDHDQEILIKTFKPINDVEGNKLKSKSIAKEQTPSKLEYNNEIEIQKIQTYITKIESSIQVKKHDTDASLEINELQILLKKLNSKLESLKK